MKLKVTRNQADMKGLFGGHKGVRFSITVKTEITDEEKQLIERYQMDSERIAKWEPEDKQKISDCSPRLDGLLSGKTVESESLGKLQDLEQQIIKGCKGVKNYLEVARSFGSEIELDID